MSQRKFNTPLTVKVVRMVGEKERRLFSWKGVSIRVESIAHDESTLICTVFQHRKAPLSKPMDTVLLVSLAEEALAPLLSAGFTPMITAMDWAHAEHLRNFTDRPEKLDPVGLISALREAGLPFPRLNSSSEEEESNVITVPFWRKALSMFAW